LRIAAIDDLSAEPYLNQLAGAPKLAPLQGPTAPVTDAANVFEEPPDRVLLPEHGKPWLTRTARRIDFAARDAANRKLGRLGEEFVVEVERARLRDIGRDDLARKVDWVATSIGDGLGFDVLSYDESDGAEQMIEVKTTGRPKYSTFYVTATEVRCSEDVADRFHLYRVFDFAVAPKLYVLSGCLRERCRLEPVQYLAARHAQGSA
jgi:Protein NO VEIN, C-terminal